MPTRDEIMAELQRRYQAGEFNANQQRAYAELQRRGVISETGTQARIPDNLQEMLGRSGLPEEDVTRLTQTGLTPGTVPEFAAAHVQERRQQGFDPSVQQQVAIQDLYRQQAGQQPRTAGRDFHQEARERQRQQKTQSVLGRAQNIGELAGTGLAHGVADVVGLFSGETGAGIREDIEQTYNPNRESTLQNLVGGGIGEGLTAAGALATGPWGMAAIYGSRGAGNVRADVAERRQQGEDISGATEAAAAVGSGLIEAASGYVGARLFGGIGRALEGAGSQLASRGGIRAVIGQGARAAGLTGTEAVEEAATEAALNLLAQGTYDPERAITEGVYEAFVLGGLLAPVLGGAANLPRTRTQAGQVPGTGSLTTGEAAAQAAQTLPESTPQAVTPRTPLEQRLVGQEGTTPAQTPLEQQLTGQQATEPTAEERDQFFGTRVSEPTVAEERFIRGSREDPVETGIDAPRTPTEGRFVGQVVEGPTPPRDLNEVQFRRWYKANVDDTAGASEITAAWGRYIPRRTSTPQRPRRLTDLPRVVSPADLSYLVAETSPLEAQEGEARLAEQDAERDYFAAELAKVEGADAGFELIHLPLDQVHSAEASDAAAVEQYAARPGQTAPPIVAGRTEASGGELTVVDGKHRVAAAKARGETSVPAYVPRGDARAYPGVMTDRGEIPVRRSQETAPAQARRAHEGMQPARKAFGANRRIQNIAREYGQTRLTDVDHTPGTLAPREARRLARDYDALVHAPEDPQVAASYAAFNLETLDQFNNLKTKGYVFEAWEGDGQPYPDVAAMARDVADNKHLYFFRTEGTTTDLPADHPLAQTAPGTGGLLYNDVFRAVHDVYGHAKDGYGFDAAGEENAWRAHSQMYSDTARGAMTTETRGQSTWVAYGQQGEANRKAIDEGREAGIVFAEQKAGLLPKEWWTAPGLRGPEAMAGSFPATDLDALVEYTVPAIDRVEQQNQIRQGVQKLGIPVGTVIRNWAPRLYGKLKQHQSAYRRDRHDADYQAKKLEDQLKQTLSGEDFLRWKYLVQTGQFQDARALYVASENATEIDNQFQTLMNLKDSWRREGVDAGLTIGYIEDHFPRQVRPDKYQEWTDELTGGQQSELDQMIAEAAARRGRALTLDERIEVANKWLAGYRHQKAGETSPRMLSRRSVEDLTFEEWQEYYQTDFTPVYSYFDRLIYNTHKARLFGKQAAEETIDESIGRIFLEESHGIAGLTRYQKERLRSAIRSIYTGGEQSPAKAIRVLRDLGYMGTLLDPTSAAIQFGDLALIAARDGTLPMLNALPQSMREQVLTAKNLGMEHLSEEYGQHGQLSSALRKGFKAVGFHKVDTAALTVNMVSAVRDGKRLVSKNRASKAFRGWAADWGPVFGDQFPELVRDLQNGVNSNLVQDYAYMQASETRPNDILDMPEAYAALPNGRILWQLKGFAMRQFDFIRKRGYQKIARGVRRNDATMAFQGVADLTRMMVLLSLAGASFDWLRDWLLGRNPDFKDSLVDGLLYTHLGSTYLLSVASREGPGTAVMDFVTPPAPGMVDSLWRDMTAGTYRSVKYLPFGKTLYSFTDEHKQKQVKYARRDALDVAAKAYLNGDRAAAQTYVNAFNKDMVDRGAEERLTMMTVRRSARARQRHEEQKHER